MGASSGGDGSNAGPCPLPPLRRASRESRSGITRRRFRPKRSIVVGLIWAAGNGQAKVGVDSRAGHSDRFSSLAEGERRRGQGWLVGGNRSKGPEGNNRIGPRAGACPWQGTGGPHAGGTPALQEHALCGGKSKKSPALVGWRSLSVSRQRRYRSRLSPPNQSVG
jgi:hypothetical protein